jgi:hypothetical protein
MCEGSAAAISVATGCFVYALPPRKCCPSDHAGTHGLRFQMLCSRWWYSGDPFWNHDGPRATDS